MRHLLADVRFALRLLLRSPGFTATLFFLLVGGIGATTAMFSVVESLLLAPLPYDHPEELTEIDAARPNESGHSSSSMPDFRDMQAQASAFSSMAALEHDAFTLSSETCKPETFPAILVSGDFFTVMRVHALRGRLLGPDDDVTGAPPRVVVSSHVWHDRFGSDPGLVGQSISVNGEPVTVVGIAPEGFIFGGVATDHVDVWAPMATMSARYPDAHDRRDNNYVQILARRRPGVTIAQAQAQLSAISASEAVQHPETDTNVKAMAYDLHDEMIDDARSGIIVLFAAIALVFLVICANVANLLLTRGAARAAEIAVRAALGASRGRLIVQLVTETVVTFLLAAAASVVVARLLTDRLVSVLPLRGGIATLAIQLDGVALLASFVISLVCGLVFGLIPAIFVTRVPPQQVLQQTAARAGSSRSHHLVRGALVVSQVALAFALLVGAGLSLRAFSNLRATDPGLAVTDRVVTSVSLSPARYPDDASRRLFVRRLVAAVSAEPGVISVATNMRVPFDGGSSSSSFLIEGRPKWPLGEQPDLERNVVTQGYFATLGIPLLRGRDFTDADRTNGRRVIIISKLTADRFFSGEDPLGKRLGFDNDGTTDYAEIIGVVGDVRRRGLSQPPVAEAFDSVEQEGVPRKFWLIVHSQRAGEIALHLPELVRQVDANEAVRSGQLLSVFVERSFGLQRTLTMLLGIFAGAALALATLGVFGLVSYSTGQRTREIGLRMALGSTPEGVVALVVRSGLSLLGIGLALGLVAALVVGRVLASYLAAVPAFDLTVYSGVPLVLMASGLSACVVPALRAVRIPPAAALRYE